MKRILGLIMFMIAVGMIIMIFIHNCFFAICIIALLLIIGYNLFTSC
ncbi:MAG: hypothetical protein ACOX76_03525 [Lachnospiraceae bacterium]